MLRLLTGERGYVTTDRDVQEQAAAALLAPSATPATALITFGARHVAVGTDAMRRVRRDAALAASVPAAVAMLPSAPVALEVPGNGVVAGGGGTLVASSPAAVKAGTASAPAPAWAPEKGTEPSRSCECHYCAHVLPRSRTLTFCPYCGQDLTLRHCPACSAEVNVQWKYCVACGRDVVGGSGGG